MSNDSVVTENAPGGVKTTPQGGWTKTLFSSWFGTALEYVDFQLYSIAAALVFNKIFFPDESVGIALMASFATYGVGFLARPLGAWFFGRLGDRVGRKRVLLITITLMGVSTALIGALPTTAQVGMLAPALLVILRIIQGFGAGAEMSGASVMLAEVAKPNNRGFISSLVALGTTSGNVAASAIWMVMVAVLSEEQLLSWGWRVPFLLSLLIMLATLWMRRNMNESPVYEETRAIAIAEAAAVSKEQVDPAKVSTDPTGRQRFFSKSFFRVLFLRFGESGNSQIFQGFLIGYSASMLGMDRSVGTAALLVSSICAFATVPFFGWLADRIGRKPTYIILSAFLLVISFPAIFALQSGVPVVLFIVVILGNSFGALATFAVQSSYANELLGSRDRFQKLALAKEFGAIISGGVASFIASGLLVLFDNAWWPIAALIAFYALVALIAAIASPETRGRDLTDPNDA